MRPGGIPTMSISPVRRQKTPQIFPRFVSVCWLNVTQYNFAKITGGRLILLFLLYPPIACSAAAVLRRRATGCGPAPTAECRQPQHGTLFCLKYHERRPTTRPPREMVIETSSIAVSKNQSISREASLDTMAFCVDLFSALQKSEVATGHGPKGIGYLIRPLLLSAADPGA